MADDQKWMSCSACRADIRYGVKHYACSVSTCNRSRTRLVFCSVPCWDSHVAILRHREAWAVEATAPSREAWAAELAAASSEPPAPAPVRRVVPTVPPTPGLAQADDTEILVVVSKLKKYIKDRAGMSTADAVAVVLSDHVRALCDLAIRAAAAASRKTVLERDVPPAR